eukprot:s642_g20.t2
MARLRDHYRKLSDNHDRERAQADRQLQHLNRERDELERQLRKRKLIGHVFSVNSNSNTPAPQMNSYQEYNSYRGQPAQGMQQGMNNWRPQPGVNSTGPMGGHMGPPGPMGAGLTQVRPASGTPGEMQIHMVIPSKFVGCILGKEGSQIKQLLSDTGCTHLAVEPTPAIFLAHGSNLYIFAVIGIGGRLNKLPNCSPGDLVLCSVKKGKPELRKKVLKGVVIRQKKAWRRREGVFVYFEDGQRRSHRQRQGRDEGICHPGPCGEGMRRAVAENCLLRTGHLLSPWSSRMGTSAKRTVREMGGFAGSNVLNVRQVSKKEPYGDADRRVIMVGGYPECAKAQEAVWQIYSENAQQAGAEASLACIMMVPSEKAGAVIGKEGSNLKQMREKFGLKVLLSKEQVEGFRPCTMSGANLEMLLEAEKQILEQISAGTENSAGNGIKRPLEGLVPATAAYTQSAYAADPEAKRHKAMPLEQQIKLLVPAKCAGAIIGKQGSTLTQIRESTGARVEVQTAAQTPPEFANARVVIIRGDFDVRQAALIKVLSAAFEETQANPELKMMVPKQVVGALIGKQGSNLKAIRENSGINVQVHKQELHGERLVEAQGPLDGILHAASLVMGSFEGPRNLQRQRQETRRQFLRVPWRWAWSDGRKEDV